MERQRGPAASRGTPRTACGDRGAHAALRRPRPILAHQAVDGRHESVPVRARCARPRRAWDAHMIARLRTITSGSLALALLLVTPVAAQEREGTPIPVPFGVGERLEYDVKFGKLRVGSGSMEV